MRIVSPCRSVPDGLPAVFNLRSFVALAPSPSAGLVATPFAVE